MLSLMAGDRSSAVQFTQNEEVLISASQPDVAVLKSSSSPSTTDTDHLDLPKPIYDELVTLYFRHVHPLCPVVDEYSFLRLYSSCGNLNDLFDSFERMLFLAMIFMAFAVN